MNDRARRVAISLAGCDFGSSGVGIFARAVVPKLVDTLTRRGWAPLVIGSRREHEGIGTPQRGRVVMPRVFDAPGPNALFSLSALPMLARSMGARRLYLPAANRRVASLPGLRTVGTVHDLAQFHVANKYGLARDLYIRRVLTPLLRSLSVVLAVSEATADDIAKYAGVERSRIRVVHNGVSLAAPSALPNPRSRPYLVYPSRLEHPGKNHVRLLEAFARSDASRTHDLLLCGKDWGALERIEKARDRLALDRRVHILGFVPDDMLSALMTHADVVVVAGLFEGFGLPAAEALSRGCPVACSNTGSLPEVVGDYAALFDPTDVASMAAALDRAVHDDDLRRSCREHGPHWTERFSWDACSDAIAEALVGNGA